MHCEFCPDYEERHFCRTRYGERHLCELCSEFYSIDESDTQPPSNRREAAAKFPDPSGPDDIGNSRRIRLKDGWSEPVVIWAAFLATSGMLKSPTMDHGTRHLRQVQDRLFGEYKEAKELYEQEDASYQEALRDWRKRSSSQRGDRPERPVAPPCTRFLVQDVTVEALVERLSDNPRGVLLATDELAGWVLAMNQYRQGKGADVQHYLSMHGARAVMYDRKGKEPVYVPRAAVSVSGPIPPAIFRRVMGQEHMENGLVPRLLVTMPPERAKRWTEADIDANIDRRMQSLVNKLAKLEMRIDDNDALGPLMVNLEPDAKELFRL